MNLAASHRVWAVVPAAGRGLRFDPANLKGPKQYAPLAGATVLEWSLSALIAEPRVAGIVVAVAAADSRWPEIEGALRASAKLKIHRAIGGGSRAESVLNGLRALASRAAAEDWVLVHDAARPCLTREDLGNLIDAVLVAAAGAGPDAPFHGAVLSSPIVDTVRRERGDAIETVDREGLWRALTPQVFRLGQLQQSLSEALRGGVTVTDEAQAMERLGFPARLVRGSPFNIKVTTPQDLSLAESVLEGLAAVEQAERGLMRIGQGFDVHAFGEGDHVVMGGVTIPYTHGVLAHSDGDVVIHALCDAILGALGLGDIGQHFPDTDPRHRGADSRVFLREVCARMNQAGLELVNADITVLAEAPRIGKYRAAMAGNLAADLGADPRRVNIKATTTEKLGFVGRGEGLAASAAVLLDTKPPR